MPYIEDGLMEIGDWEIELDYDPAIATWDADDWLDPSPEGRPLTHLLVYEGERLAAPPLPLLRRRGDDRGFVIGGPGIEWYQGGDVGPLIEFAEFISGNNRLPNYDFAKGFTHWSRAEGSYWVMDGGLARLNGNNQVDDVLVNERGSFDVREGQEWKATALVSRLGLGAGRFRARIVFTGRFSHPNLLPQGNFEDAGDWTTGPHSEIETGGQRSGESGLRIGPIPKPQLVTNSDFSGGGTGWSAAGEMTATTDPVAGVTALACLPIPYPQLLLNPGLEHATLGYSWGVATIPGDIGILASAEAKSGSNVMRVGPITQHQVFINADFGTGLTNWYSSSSDADPHAVWSVDVGGGNNGTDGVRSTGWSTAGRPGPELIKYLRADSVAGSGVNTYAVVPGEAYRVEAYFKGHPGTDGKAFISIMIPHPTVPGYDQWYHSNILTAPPNDVGQWVAVAIESLTIPANRTAINALGQLHNHSLGHWSLDTFTMTRIRGNRARSTSLPYVVEPNSQYRFRCSARSDADHQVGSVKLGGRLLGTGDPEDVSATQGNTDLTWARVTREFTPTEDQNLFEPYVEGEDLFGRFWLDDFALEKISNNSRQSTHLPFALTEGQRYTLASTVRPDATISRGSVTVGVILSGAGVPDMEIPLDFGFSDTGEPMASTTDFVPDPGYALGETFVRSTDVEGGTFYVHKVEVIKADNNRDSTDGPTFPVTPERPYQLAAHARSDAAMTGGYAYVSLSFTATGRTAVVEDSPPMEMTDDGDGAGPVWKLSPWDFTPPSGYGSATVKIVGVDVDGGPLWLDDVTVVDADPTTSVADVQSAVTFTGTLEVTATVPAGAERVHVAGIAEKEGYGWRVHEMSLARVVDTPATGEDVIRSLLVDPDTGAELPVVAGDIDAPDVISADWEVRNLDLRDAQRQFASSVASPVLEWWTDVDRRQHWGPAESLFVDHAPGTAEEVLFLECDLPVESLPPRDEDASNRASKVKIIGAERPTATGSPSSITATATDTSGTRDYNGRPLNRSLLVEDSTNDHQGQAEAAAATGLVNNAQPVRTFDVPLSDTRTYPAMKSGDWVYAHKASAGMVGAYPVETQQGTVYAERFRIIGRRRELGDGYRFVLRKGPGAEMELTGVRIGTNRTTLTLGERRPPDITTDAAGRPLADSVLRLRASSPR